MTHIFVYRLTKGRKIPRWFNEGLAIHISGELLLERIKLLVKAASGSGSSLLSLKEIEVYFPESDYKANLAYAEAADFVSYLYRVGGKYRIRGLLLRIAKGESFERAIMKVFGKPLPILEREWIEKLWLRYSYFPIITSSTTLWGIIVLFFIWAYIKRLKEKKKRMEEMEDEEDL